jgi:hypothetical protein
MTCGKQPVPFPKRRSGLSPENGLARTRPHKFQDFRVSMFQREGLSGFKSLKL